MNSVSDEPHTISDAAERQISPAISKELKLRALFREMGSVVVAFSGGVDSTYVAFIANSELGEVLSASRVSQLVCRPISVRKPRTSSNNLLFV